ncbi:MAG: hypothetical protein OQJ76_03765 [Rhodospirillales bacterium]|nr:hypothetical protein [Rhodospirillales bacterium]
MKSLTPSYGQKSLFRRIAGATGIGFIALALTALPVTIDSGFSFAEKDAVAKGKGGGGKGGGKGGGGKGGSSGGKGGGGKGSASTGSSSGGGVKGGGYGGSKRGAYAAKSAKTSAYGKAVGKMNEGVATASFGDGKGDKSVGKTAHTFSSDESASLARQGWMRHSESDDFSNHGDRVRTMVAIAKALGYNASVGAMQANFGTPQENAPTSENSAEEGAGTETTPTEGEVTAPTEIAASEPTPTEGEATDGDAETTTAEGDATEGEEGGKVAWASVNLDVNGDGIVSKADLTAALSGQTPEGETGGETGDGTGGATTGDTGTDTGTDTGETTQQS